MPASLPRWDVLSVSLELIASLREVVTALQVGDRDLAGQIRRAASSIALNLAEGRRRAGKDRTQFYCIAAGSAAEVATALDVAQAWGTLDPADTAEARALLDRVLAMLYRLTH